ncbi:MULTISPECIES: MarR family winged helix-turn-helix transcriptional regulator [unclassified Curtobacterium]|uniref:MarR family winged helix-turn-helix transcriptional regulator n=1 Tax=unclassified Curtobacterium TaxID=257496 RepID=UPI000DA7E216|nr:MULTISPECIES: MarR family winged helix-turn-helix transcriptional regulator [unclassified Curtobacterium]PZE64293.1 MarR family transcriptional regulator [Curtobacterium sp. MCBD17_021]WIB26687.1 MarR family winged helix-turn-helix transcriptional regulator [Curtobacterium sp. MCSS17_015]
MTSPASDDALAELADAVLRVARELDPTGPRSVDVVPLTGTEVLVMRWVDTNPGTTPSATAEATALRRSNLSVALGSLVAKGMVERRTHPDDARLAQLYPTALAAESIGLLRARWTEALRAALDVRGVDAAAVTSAVGLLQRIEDGLRPPRGG